MVSNVVAQVSRVVKPEAAGAVATTFGFPLSLMGSVVMFLVFHRRLDERDPKLRDAPQRASDTLVYFREEAHL